VTEPVTDAEPVTPSRPRHAPPTPMPTSTPTPTEEVNIQVAAGVERFSAPPPHRPPHDVGGPAPREGGAESGGPMTRRGEGGAVTEGRESLPRSGPPRTLAELRAQLEAAHPEWSPERLRAATLEAVVRRTASPPPS
jgi:hypothetical protein